jgi:hypothetical protein
VIDSFNEDSEYVEATFSLANENTISTGSIYISATSPLTISAITSTPNVWNQSYITFNTDGTANHFNTLDCSLIVPEDEADCYDEGCVPIEVEDGESVTSCEEVDCGTHLAQSDCYSWNSCLWENEICVDFELSADDMTWELDCNNLILGTTQFNISIVDNIMSISSSQDYCSIADIQGYYQEDDCYDYAGPASDLYGISGHEIDALVVTSSLHYSLDETPSMRDNNSRFVDNPINRPKIFSNFRWK